MRTKALSRHTFPLQCFSHRVVAATNSAVRKIERLDDGFFRRLRRLKDFHVDLIALVAAGASS